MQGGRSLKVLELADLAEDLGKAPGDVGRTREQEVMRVHAAAADRRRDSLATAAGVLRVRQPAARLHEPDDRSPGTSEALAEGRRRGLESGGRLAMIQLQDLAEDVGEPVLAIKTERSEEH